METILFETQLKNFHGTEQYHKHSLANGFIIVLTDGASYLREEAPCYWLFDFIAAYQTHKDLRGQRFQVWKLEKKNSSWEFSCEDGNENQLYSRKIEFSDFPLDAVTIWFVDGVAMLPSEY
ncbi:MAG: hypothetical protein M3R17_17920 [Bacteroidota bacterium]|nr:hypothetical protein [Bacteroidota bacterium]